MPSATGAGWSGPTGRLIPNSVSGPGWRAPCAGPPTGWPRSRRSRNPTSERSASRHPRRAEPSLHLNPTPGRSVGAGSLQRGAVEVLAGAARRRAALALVPGAVRRAAVRVLGGRGQPEEAELADLHPGVELDRQGGHIGQLEGDVAGEAG